MPNGEFKLCKNVDRNSATPSPSVSRKSVMRLALGTPAPARFITHFITQPLMPLFSSCLGGALLSATNTSPLGSTINQRGWSRPLANADTRVPGTDCGVAPTGQPLAGAIFTVGTSVRTGRGSAGLLPIPAEIGSLATSPQPPNAIANTSATPSNCGAINFFRTDGIDKPVIPVKFCPLPTK